MQYTSIRYLLALAVELILDIDQMDPATAFLQSDFSDQIDMLKPVGFSVLQDL